MNLDSNEYKHIWQILTALMEQDSDIADMVKNAASNQGESGGRSGGGLDKLICINANSEELIKLINIKILNHLYAEWDKSYIRLKAYLKENSSDTNALTSDKYFIAWISKQKELFKNGLLSKDRQKLLEELGINLMPRLIDPSQRWIGRYHQLKDYYEKDKNCYINMSLPEELRTWSAMVRNQKVKGELTTEQHKLLRDIDFPANVVHARWDVAFEEYKRLLKSKQLTKRWYDWELRQKVDFKINKMSKHRIDALRSIDFNFTYKEAFNYKNTSFAEHEHYKKFAELVKKYGCIPHKESSALRALGKHLKAKYANNELAESSIKILNSMGFILDSTVDARVERSLQRYANHVKNKKPILHSTPIGTWCADMRQRKKEGKLSKYVIDRLNAIGFEWKVATDYIRDKKGKILKRI